MTIRREPLKHRTLLATIFCLVWPLAAVGQVPEALSMAVERHLLPTTQEQPSLLQEAESLDWSSSHEAWAESTSDTTAEESF